MKNKNWINKTYFFFSRVAIRHRLPNLPPVCALRNARLRRSAQLCLNRGPLPVTPGGACSTAHTWGVVAPWRTETRLRSPTKARRWAWEMNYTAAKGMRANRWCLPYRCSSGTIICFQTFFSRATERSSRTRPPLSNQPTDLSTRGLSQLWRLRFKSVEIWLMSAFGSATKCNKWPELLSTQL